MSSAAFDAGQVAQASPGLRLLVLHGSRARADAFEGSDWDFAYLADPDFDELDLRWRLTSALRTDAVDVASLSRAGGLLRYRVARDGKLLWERERGEFERFVLDAVLFWLDVEPIVRAAYRDVLEDLG
jgi:predicted nucleotidyltransferase